jgi:transposase InsO family protein
MTRELRDEGFNAGRRRTARLMREHGLNARQKRRFKRTTDSHHAFPIAPNLIDQDFSAERPNQKWAADISYVWTREGWLYLAVILDLFSRRVVGWAARDRRHKELALEALDKALAIRRPQKGLIHHSDSQRIEASSRTSDSRKRWTVWYVGAAGCPVWFDPHSDRLDVSFPGPVDPPGAPCGEAAPRRCL